MWQMWQYIKNISKHYKSNITFTFVLRFREKKNKCLVGNKQNKEKQKTALSFTQTKKHFGLLVFDQLQ